MHGLAWRQSLSQSLFLLSIAWLIALELKAWSKIAQHMASADLPGKTIIVDCFAGVGGNTISFARSNRWVRVYAIENDPTALECAKHNAKIYGVSDRISWFLGDCFEIIRNKLSSIRAESVVFASPPWGGVSPYWVERPLIPFNISRSGIPLGANLWPRLHATLQFVEAYGLLSWFDRWHRFVSSPHVGRAPAVALR